jgi:hypothetical protein
MNTRASQRYLLIALSLFASIATSGCVAESSNDFVDDNEEDNEENVSSNSDESIVVEDVSFVIREKIVVENQGSDFVQLQSVSEASLLEDDLLDAKSDDIGQRAALSPSTGLASCVASTVDWTVSQPMWNGNANTAGIYKCSGNLPSVSSGTTIFISGNSATRTGVAQVICNNGTWQGVAGACDGKVISTAVASGISTECSSPIAVRSKWIGWYLADLERCADTAGLDWWVAQYNSNAACTAATNFDGYGSKDACYRDYFRMAANANANSYSVAQALGHVAPSDEANLCGSQAGYPWTSVSAVGMSCKYRP